jgi:murein DD-endopeptidase MepM/ murein hydrolase activator NlpD/predicted chitinase
MDEHEINALFEKLRLGITLTDEEMAKLAASLSGATTATQKFQKALKDTTEDLLKTMGGFATGADAGAGNFKALNPVIDLAAKTTKTMANAAGDVVGAFGPVGAVVGGALKAIGNMSGLVADASKYMVGEMQKSADAFNQFGQVGALTVKGMTGVQEQFVRSGMQLESFTKTISQNAETMARFRGTVGEGAEDFSKVVGDIIDSDVGKELRRIGFSADQIGEGAAAFVKQQTQLGMSQKKTNAELTAGSVEYLKQQDLLAKVTGMSRKAIEDQQQAALSEGRFRAQTDEMVANGQEKQAKTLMDFQTMVSKAAPEMAAGLRDAASGFVSSSAAQKLFMDTGGAATDIIEKVKNGSMDQVEAYRQLQAATKGQMQVSRDITKVIGDEGGTWSKYADKSNFVNSKIVNGQVELLEAQKKQMKEGTDPLTDSTVAAQESMQQMFRQMQQFGFKVMPQAAVAVEAFTRSTNRFLRDVAKATGARIPGQEEADAKEFADQEAKVAAVITPMESLVRGAAKGMETIAGWIPFFGDYLKSQAEGTRIDNEQAEANRRLAKLPKLADGGITKGLSFAGEAGPEAVIPLKGGKVPIDFGSGLDKLMAAGATKGMSTADQFSLLKAGIAQFARSQDKDTDPMAALKAGIAQFSGSQDKAAGSTAADFAKTIPPLTKAIIPFTEALNNFTAMTQETAKAGVREGEEARKGESMFDKMVSFIANLFGPESKPGGGTRGAATQAGAAPPAADMTAAMNAHDASHKHEPPTVTPEAAKQLGQGIGSPLENLKVTSGFGMRIDPITGKQAGHGGVDLAGRAGDAIKAPDAGTARVVAEKDSGGYGNMVEILDAQGKVMHRMAHMSETMVKTGDKIEAGTQIGKVGSTGRSTGNHLHWEQFDTKTGKQIDPIAALAARQGMTPGYGSTASGAATGNPQITRQGQAAGAPQVPNVPMAGNVQNNLGMMTKALQDQGITDPKMITATLASVMKETGGKINAEEDLAGYANTSNERIRSLFGARAAKKSDKELDAIKKDPKQFAEMMYGKDSGMGLGNTEEGDAYKYRGRGAVQLTGKANYASASKDLFGDDRLVKDPELLKDPEMAAKTSAWFMKKNQGAMAKRMGMEGGPKDQTEANLLAASTIAGSVITPGKGYLGGENLNKVNAYSAQLGGGQIPVAAAPVAGAVPGAPVMAAAGAVPGAPVMAAAGAVPGAPVMAAAPAQSPLESIMSAFLGPQLGGGIAGLFGGAPAAPTTGMAGPVLPGTPSAGGGTGDLVAAIKEQGQSTANAITTSIASLKDSIGTSGAAGGEGGQVPELLNQLIGAQRDQTAAINRLIQAQTA